MVIWIDDKIESWPRSDLIDDKEREFLVYVSILIA